MAGARVSQPVPLASPAAVQVPSPQAVELLEPPVTTQLGASATEFWKRCAGHAIAERTLTPATAVGFSELCEQWALTASIHARIQLLGADTREAEPLLKTYIKLAQRLDVSLARFKLTAFGKPATAEKPKAAVNPFQSLAGR